MYLVYNRDYKLVGEYEEFKEVQAELGSDVSEANVNSLEFIRGRTVVTQAQLKDLLGDIVNAEKDGAIDYIVQDIENREDETVELRTLNNQLNNTIKDRTGLLQVVSGRLGEALTHTEHTDKTVNVTPKPKPAVKEAPVVTPKKELTKEEPKQVTPKNTNHGQDLEDSYDALTDSDLEEIDGGVEEEIIEETEEEPTPSPKGLSGMDDETLSVLQHIEKNHKRKVKPKTRKVKYNKINFINILEGGEIKQINQLKGVNLVKTEPLAKSIGLDTEHIEYLIGNTLKGCGGSPKNLNKNVVAPDEAVWVIVSALVKREGYGNTQRFQKTQENAIDFFKSWEGQREEINKFLK